TRARRARRWRPGGARVGPECSFLCVRDVDGVLDLLELRLAEYALPDEVATVRVWTVGDDLVGVRAGETGQSGKPVASRAVQIDARLPLSHGAGVALDRVLQGAEAAARRARGEDREYDQVGHPFAHGPVPTATTSGRTPSYRLPPGPSPPGVRGRRRG